MVFRKLFVFNAFVLAVALPGLSLNTAIAAVDEESSATSEMEKEKPSWLKRNFGVNYNIFVSGPALLTGETIPPDFTGGPSDSGMNAFNLISAKWKFSSRFALDLQFRNQIVFTHAPEFRYQGQRLGISGTFLKGETWSFAGALNSDIPIAGLAGQLNEQRKLIANPGFFAFFNWAPTNSKWSVFALMAPRMWFYSDRNALASQDVAACGQNETDPAKIAACGLKRKYEYTIFINPSINYAINEKVGVRLGTTLEYSKFVGFDNIRRSWMPFELGVTYDISPAFSIYTYILTSTPLDDGLRRDLMGNNAQEWWKTASLNIWLSGTLF